MQTQEEPTEGNVQDGKWPTCQVGDLFRCTVYDGDAARLFPLEGVDEGLLAATAYQRAHKEYPRDLLHTLRWQFEKVYPKRPLPTQEEPTEGNVQDGKWPTYQVGDSLDINGVHFVIQRFNVSNIVIRPVPQKGLSPRRIMRLLRGR